MWVDTRVQPIAIREVLHALITVLGRDDLAGRVIEPPRLLRLRAELRLPGEAWLEWAGGRRGPPAGAHQRALFVPRGLFGRAYWYAMVPFHGLIFQRLVEEIARRAEDRGGSVVSGA